MCPKFRTFLIFSLVLKTSNFNEDISNWDISRATDMSHMFDEAFRLNQNISNWDVSRVTSMLRMFNEASRFNQDLSKWNVSRVTNMQGCFQWHYHSVVPLARGMSQM